MEKVKEHNLRKQNFLNNILFTLLLLIFGTTVAITINSDFIALLFILTPAALVNIIWILMHTNSVFKRNQ
jgi:hypothetical protein